MKKSFLYYLLMAATWPMQLFPLEFHYVVSELLYLVVYKLFGYRKNVVRKNLNNAFPELTPLERKKIEKDFYMGFVDLFIETLYFTHIDIDKEKYRLDIVNLQLVEEMANKGKNMIIVMGHLGNWEYIRLFNRKINAKIFFIYKKINNKAFDQFFRDMRRRNGGIPLEMKQTFRTLHQETQLKRPFMALFLSDQRPLKGEIKHWVNFMNQETPVMLGTEKIARKTDAAVIYLEMTKTKRGHQRMRFELICENSVAAAENEITDTFMQKLEQSIQNAPDQYLWTHNRWKFKRTDFGN